jgi:DNA-directed RNA polymerase specialized sigma24 family protein
MAPRELREGVEHDIERLYRESAPQLWRSIYGFAGGRRHLAEDAVAEAFARAIERANQIRDPLAWIYRTAFRIASRELQREKRLPPPAPDPVPGPWRCRTSSRRYGPCRRTSGRPYSSTTSKGSPPLRSGG